MPPHAPKMLSVYSAPSPDSDIIKAKHRIFFIVLSNNQFLLFINAYVS